MNTKVGKIAGEVGQTPSAWNESIFSMIRNLSENVMIPIAGLIISAILCYELITMVMDKNNVHEVGSEFFFRYLVKACVAVMLLSKTFDITMAIHEANTETRKAELFGKVRSGQVRFLLGSTQKMGAGTNVQDRLIALHHLDVPWRPSEEDHAERYINKSSKIKAFRISVTAWSAGHYRNLQGKLNMEQISIGEGIAICSPFLIQKRRTSDYDKLNKV